MGSIFPGGSDGKEFACSAGDLGLIPGLGRSPRDGNGNPLQYSSLENSMVRGAWKATVHGFAKSRTQLSDFTFTFSSSALCFTYPMGCLSSPLYKFCIRFLETSMKVNSTSKCVTNAQNSPSQASAIREP